MFIIRTIVAATCPVLGLSPLDDGRHRHHRFLLLHHLARLLDRSTFTRHRGPIYLVGFLSFTHAHPPEAARHPGVFLSSRVLPLFFFLFFSSFFSFLFKRISPHRVISRKSFLPPCPFPSFPSPELNSFFWYRFGMVAHCTSLVRSWSIARPVT